MNYKNILTLWILVVACLLLWLGAAYAIEPIANCKPYHEQIIYEGNKISIIGTWTEEAKEACNLDWKYRQKIAKQLVQDELNHIRLRDIETRKTEVLGRLQTLKSSNVNVSTRIRNEWKVKQMVEQSA